MRKVTIIACVVLGLAAIAFLFLPLIREAAYPWIYRDYLSLARAVSDGDYHAVVRYGSRRRNWPNFRYRNGKYLVHSLDDVSDTRIIEYIAKRAVLDRADLQAQTALHACAITGNVYACERLLAHGANPNAVDRQGWTPLHWAVQTNHPAVAALLLDNGADVNRRSDIGQPPLFLAAKQGSAACVGVLLQQGAGKSIPSGDKILAADIAAAEHHTAIAALLRADTHR